MESESTEFQHSRKRLLSWRQSRVIANLNDKNRVKKGGTTKRRKEISGNDGLKGGNKDNKFGSDTFRALGNKKW